MPCCCLGCAQPNHFSSCTGHLTIDVLLTYLLATIANRIIVFSFFKPFLDLVEVSQNVSK